MTVQPVVFKVTERPEGGYSVELLRDGKCLAQGKFAADLSPDSRLSRTIELIEDNVALKDDLAIVGEELWAGLLSGDIARRYGDIVDQTDRRSLLPIHLDIPSELSDLPWETLWDSRLRFLSARPNYCVSRTLAEAAPGVAPERADDSPLKILVAVPEDSGLQVGHELRNLGFLSDRLGDHVVIERVDGAVTPTSLASRLEEAEPDIFLFVGHGRVNDDGDVEIRLNREEHESERSRWIDADRFAAIFAGTSVQLAVLNCCQGAVQSSSLTLSGVGPFLGVEGVQAVVAMRYEIGDDDAIRFSEAFFSSLLSEDTLGRVEHAVSMARRELHLTYGSGNARAFVTPVLYLAPGFAEIAGLKAVPSKPDVVSGEGAADLIALPERLVDAIRERRCVPLIGPGVLRSGSTRTGENTPEPRSLARSLAEACQYPNMHEFEAAERAEELLAETVLERVCEHFLYQHPGDVYGLVTRIRDAFRGVEVQTAVKQMATWSVPGFICSYFDGQLHEALKRAGSHPRVINKVDEQLVLTGGATGQGTSSRTGGGEGDDDPPLLVHLRGTVTDGDSLVLTEQENDDLWDRMTALGPDVVNLVHNVEGCSLLLIGVNPQDKIVRRFVNQLLGEAAAKLRGPVYFVQAPGAAVDRAYWKHLEVNWIDADTEALVATVTAKMPRAGAGR